MFILLIWGFLIWYFDGQYGGAMLTIEGQCSNLDVSVTKGVGFC